jgi:uncharacterized metal-binding protein
MRKRFRAIIYQEDDMSSTCCSDSGTVLLYPCSGAADVGELTDRAVRKLWKEGFAAKTCLAGVGAGISGFVQSAKGADVNITVDGCPHLCAKKTLERAGVQVVSHVVTDMGFVKNQTHLTDENIEKVASRVRSGKTSVEPVPEPVKSSGCGCSCGGTC